MNSINRLFNKAQNLCKTSLDKLTGKNILLTGAAGTVGAGFAEALCRADTSFNRLILLDHNDSSLNYLYHKLDNKNVIPTLGNYCDTNLMRLIIKKYDIHIVIHCAAYKIVPIVNMNPQTSFCSNVAGSNALFEICGLEAVQNVVFVSSYEAYNAVNVFGYTKKLAELLMLNCANKYTNTKFNAFRFGFILSSSGSVAQIFENQAKENINLTLTHKDVQRYMCTVHDVVNQIIYLCGIEDSGNVFTLDMDEPVNIYDIAQYFINKYNSKSNIVVTQLRPGDKIFESPLSAECGLHKCSSPIQGLFVNGRENLDWLKIEELFKKLNDICMSNYVTDEYFSSELADVCQNYIN